MADAKHPQHPQHPRSEARIQLEVVMPIYEYRCSRCGHELETLQKISEARLSVCPACGEEALVKKVSAAGFQLKGTGWYATDFKSSGAKPTATPATEPATATDTAKADAPVTDAAKSSDAKPESSKSASDTPSESKRDAKPESAKSASDSSESKRDAKPASSTPGGPTTGPAGQ